MKKFVLSSEFSLSRKIPDPLSVVEHSSFNIEHHFVFCRLNGIPTDIPEPFAKNLSQSEHALERELSTMFAQAETKATAGVAKKTARKKIAPASSLAEETEDEAVMAILDDFYGKPDEHSHLRTAVNITMLGRMSKPVSETDLFHIEAGCLTISASSVRYSQDKKQIELFVEGYQGVIGGNHIYRNIEKACSEDESACSKFVLVHIIEGMPFSAGRVTESLAAQELERGMDDYAQMLTLKANSIAGPAECTFWGNLTPEAISDGLSAFLPHLGNEHFTNMAKLLMRCVMPSFVYIHNHDDGSDLSALTIRNIKRRLSLPSLVAITDYADLPMEFEGAPVKSKLIEYLDSLGQGWRHYNSPLGKEIARNHSLYAQQWAPVLENLDRFFKLLYIPRPGTPEVAE